jgi:tetratricopeptide (TPR) repeat protein
MTLGLVLVLGMPAWADDWTDCISGDHHALQIAACTAILNSNAYTEEKKAVAHYDRGIAYNNEEQYDRAIRDFDRVIKFSPSYVDAYNNRGLAYKDKGQYDRAIQDFDKAISIRPDFERAYNNRGRSCPREWCI